MGRLKTKKLKLLRREEMGGKKPFVKLKTRNERKRG